MHHISGLHMNCIWWKLVWNITMEVVLAHVTVLRERNNWSKLQN